MDAAVIYNIVVIIEVPLALKTVCIQHKQKNKE